MTRNYRNDHQGQGAKQGGMFSRVTHGLADKTGLPRKYIIAGLVIGAIVEFPLTVIVFFGTLYWLNHPGKLERKVDKMKSKIRNVFSSDGSYQRQYSPAYASPTADMPDPTEDVYFSDLKRQFQDLERRASDMEEKVTSDEYKLNDEFRKMDKSDT